jgi:hypothetical protein
VLGIDPWDKAAECERAIEVVADPERRDVLMSLRTLWIALGNGKPVFDGAGRAVQVSTIARIHAEVMSARKNAMH